MDGSLERDKRKGKAKVEEADEISLPPKSNINIIKHVDYYFMKLVGELRDKDKAGPDSLEPVTRNVFRVRYKDVENILGHEDERLKNIHSVSGATIGISSSEARSHRQAYLELMGTIDEVKIAELLIVDAIIEIYEKPFVPAALMPKNICHHAMFIPLPKVTSLLGFDGHKLMKIEAESGTWIEEPVYLEHAWASFVEEFTWTEEAGIKNLLSRKMNSRNTLTKIGLVNKLHI